MPWSPPSAPAPVRDPRLDPYRDRAGALLDGDGTQVARFFVGTGPLWTRTGGHLWWSRWSAPVEAVEGHVGWAGGGVSEWFSAHDALDADLAEWEAGAFTVDGTTYRVEWLDEVEAERLRAELRGTAG